ncbi:MAG TPA: hypothetical protein VFE60_13125, partial [Roseiarcus sp.]|nr:hypothetical protein [Roseiarcus sp.]
MSAKGGEAYFVLAMERQILLALRSFPCDSCRRASRPIEASKAAVCYVRNTSILLKNPLFWRQHLGFVALSAREIPGSSPHVAKIGAGSGMS